MPFTQTDDRVSINSRPNRLHNNSHPSVEPFGTMSTLSTPYVQILVHSD
jgi:hypothetical protein